MKYKRKMIEHYNMLSIILNKLGIKYALTWIEPLTSPPPDFSANTALQFIYCNLLKMTLNGSNKNKTDSFGGIT